MLDELGEVWESQLVHSLGLVVEGRKDSEDLRTWVQKVFLVRDLLDFQSENRDYPVHPLKGTWRGCRNQILQW